MSGRKKNSETAFIDCSFILNMNCRAEKLQKRGMIPNIQSYADTVNSCEDIKIIFVITITLSVILVL